MAHDIPLHMRCAHQDDLTACGIAPGVADTGHTARCVAGAVENNPGRWVGFKNRLEIGNFLSDEAHAVLVLEPGLEVFEMCGGVYGDGGEGNAEADTLGKLLLRYDNELIKSAFFDSSIAQPGWVLTSSKYSAIILIFACGTSSSQYSVLGVRTTNDSLGFSEASLVRCA